MKSVYIETSIPSYLTTRPSRDVRALAWKQLTHQWWDEERGKYNIYVSELVLAEASIGHPEAVARRLKSLKNIPEVPVDEEMINLASLLIKNKGIPSTAEADALHVAVAVVHDIDYLLTWNCRHINNAAMKQTIRKIMQQCRLFMP